MKVPAKFLFIKKSSLPEAGRGLFTKILIPKGYTIVEYKGKITTWKNANHINGKNLYIFYVNKDHVIDANNYKSMLARFANDARGLSKVQGLKNNSDYVIEKGKVYIKATRDIAAGAEIFVSYGKAYWDVIKKL